MLPLSDLVVTGARGDGIPYLEYIEVDIAVKKEDVGINKSMTTLALICPSPPSDSNTAAIISTNSGIIRALL